MRYVSGFGRFWWDFVIGEDWRIAASVAVILAVVAVLVATTGLSDHVLTVGAGIAIGVIVPASIVGPALRARR